MALGVDLLDGCGAASFALNVSIICVGKVWPFSHMSSNFLIFSYTQSIYSELLAMT